MHETSKIRVLVVDDHPVVRAGVRALIAEETDMEVVGEASNGPDALALYEATSPDVTLLDLRLPGMSGAEVVSTIRQHHPEAPIIIFTTYDGDPEISRAVAAGACGVLFKGTFPDGILEASIRKVHAGGKVLPTGGPPGPGNGEKKTLSAREIQIVEMVARGLANKEIAHALGLSEMTIKYHLKRVYAKLGVRDRTEAAMRSAQCGLINMP